MNMQTTFPQLWRAHTRASSLGLAVAFLMSLSACDTLLDVSNPGSVEATDLDNPALASTLVHSAVGHFECALTSYVASAGMLSNEMVNASGFAALNPWGWRGVELQTATGTCPGSRTSNTLGAYTPLQQARYLSEEATRLIEGFPDEEVPGKVRMLGELAVYGAFAYTLLGEGFCAMAVDEGPLMTTDEVLAIAEQRFDLGISHAEAAGDTDLRLLAVAGRARVRLNLGNLQGAAADAAEIPEGWVWNSEYSTIDPSRENRLYNLNHHSKTVGINWLDYGPDAEGAKLGDVHDPRLAMEDAGETGHDGQTPLWLQLKYPSPDTPIPMASWEEAQLILAEARPEEAVELIDRLRESQNLPPLELAGNEDIVEVVLEERRRQLFLEGHRLNDMLRHDIPFPEGTNHKGQPWGPITCLPLPDQERDNNPNIGS